MRKHDFTHQEFPSCYGTIIHEKHPHYPIWYDIEK